MKIFIIFMFVCATVAAFVFLFNKRTSREEDTHTMADWPPDVVARVENDRAAREEVRRRYPELFAAVSAAMFRHDVIGLNFDTNSDEYDPEAGTVIPRLKDCSSAEDVATVLHEEYSNWFGPKTAGAKVKYAALVFVVRKNIAELHKGIEP